jgi:hypothetical protein
MKPAVLVIGLGIAFTSAPADAEDEPRSACTALPAMISSFIPDFFTAVRSCAEDPQGSGTLYEIAGTHHGSERRAFFDGSGALIGLDETIDVAFLPAAMLVVMANRYAGLPILRVLKKRRATSVFYEVRIEKDGEQEDILFNASGMRGA